MSNDRAPTSSVQASGQASGFVADLNGAIRDNPVAAGLIGLGLAWLVFGNRGVGRAFAAAGPEVDSAMGRASDSLGHAWDATARSAGRAADAVGQTGASIAGAARGAAQDIAETASRTMSRTSDRVSGIAGDVADYAGSASRTVARSSSELAESAQERLQEMMERQPLVLGAIGLVIGAGLASAFASTRTEVDVLGESSAHVRAKARELAETARLRAEKTVSDVASEAERQGLTPDAAKEALGALKDKATTIAAAAVDGARGRH